MKKILKEMWVRLKEIGALFMMLNNRHRLIFILGLGFFAYLVYQIALKVIGAF